MSILTSLIENIQKEQEHKHSAKSKLVDFEKMIADEARSQGMLPRTYLEQLCQKSESFANSKLVKVLMGEQSAVDEGKVKDMLLDMEADAAEMSKEEFIKAHGSQNADIWDRVQDEMRGDTNEGAVKDYLMDLEDDATKMNKDDFVKKHGEGKAKIWDKVNSPDYKDISDLMDGNEFAQKVRQLKAQGAKSGTKFKTSDGQEHTLEQMYAQTLEFMSILEKKIKEQSQPVEENAPITEQEFEALAEKKDACYHKVKSRYKVWPSAYASGALVQCRKVGAANWGNKSKK